MAACFRTLALAALAVLAAGAPHAQSAAGAEAAAQAYADAVAAQDWAAAAALTDSTDLARLADLFDVIAAFAEGEEDPLGLDEVESPQDAFVALMEFVSQQPMMGDVFGSISVTLLGSVAESDTLVHVLARTQSQMFGSDVSGIEVTTARWDGTRWVVKLKEEMEGMITAMETAFANPALLEGFGDEPGATPTDPKKER